MKLWATGICNNLFTSDEEMYIIDENDNVFKTKTCDCGELDNTELYTPINFEIVTDIERRPEYSDKLLMRPAVEYTVNGKSIRQIVYEFTNKCKILNIPYELICNNYKIILDCRLGFYEEPEKFKKFAEEYKEVIQQTQLKGCVNKLHEHLLRQSSIRNFRIGNTVVDVGDNTFLNCTNLEDVELGKWVIRLGDGAFWQCSNLKNIKFNKNLKIIGDDCFSSTAIEEIVIPDGVEYIGRQAFEHCVNLRYVEIPNSVEYLGTKCFDYCTNLEYLKIPKKLEPIIQSQLNLRLKHIELIQT